MTTPMYQLGRLVRLPDELSDIIDESDIHDIVAYINHKQDDRDGWVQTYNYRRDTIDTAINSLRTTLEMLENMRKAILRVEEMQLTEQSRRSTMHYNKLITNIKDRHNVH